MYLSFINRVKMFHSKILAPQGGILKNGGSGTFRQDKVPKQYELNLSEPNVGTVGTLRGASASAAPIVAVNKARFDNRSSTSAFTSKTSSENLTYFNDFRDAMKIVSGSESATSYQSLKPDAKPVPTHSKSFQKILPLMIQACIDMNYGKDNVLYDNTSKSLKFSTPANGRIVPERKELFGMLLDDLHRVENGQFPVHSEWFDAFGTRMTPSKATKFVSILERISRLIQFTKENNTWLGKGCDHIKSIMNALLIKNLLNPKTYQKQKYFTHFYRINETAYDDHQGRAIRGQPKPVPLTNAALPALPFPSIYIMDILRSFRQESQAAQEDVLRQAELAARMAAEIVVQQEGVRFNQVMDYLLAPDQRESAGAYEVGSLEEFARNASVGHDVHTAGGNMFRGMRFDFETPAAPTAAIPTSPAARIAAVSTAAAAVAPLPAPDPTLTAAPPTVSVPPPAPAPAPASFVTPTKPKVTTTSAAAPAPAVPSTSSVDPAIASTSAAAAKGIPFSPVSSAPIVGGGGGGTAAPPTPATPATPQAPALSFISRALNYLSPFKGASQTTPKAPPYLMHKYESDMEIITRIPELPASPNDIGFISLVDLRKLILEKEGELLSSPVKDPREMEKRQKEVVALKKRFNNRITNKGLSKEEVDQLRFSNLRA